MDNIARRAREDEVSVTPSSGTLHESAVRDALHAIRYQRTLRGNPLTFMTCLERRLARAGVSADERARESELATLLEATVVEHLEALRLERPSRHSVAGLPSDFSSDSTDLECWSALYHRFLADRETSVRVLAESAGVGMRMFDRRLTRGYRLLRDSLTELESRPDHAATMARLRATEDEAGSLPTYLAGRVAAWEQGASIPDRGYFIPRSCVIPSRSLVSPDPIRVENLAAALELPGCQALVLLGAPGAGKSTALRQTEYLLAQAAESSEIARVPLLASLRAFPAEVASDPLATPEEWASSEWSRRGVGLPPLSWLIAQGRLALLLDGLNELPAADDEERRRHVRSWKSFVHSIVGAHPDNRVVVSSRTLDYAAPLSTPEKAVREVTLEPLSNEVVRIYMRARLGEAGADTLWEALRRSPLLALARLPFFLDVLAQASSAGLPTGPSAVITMLVRHTLRREIERDHPLLEPGRLLGRRDYVRAARATEWQSPWDLPDASPLIAGLTELAYRLQGAVFGESRCVSVQYEWAANLLVDYDASALLEVGAALGLLDDDRDHNTVSFHHQLLQEYFAARRLALAFDSKRVARPWRTDDVSPSLETVLARLSSHDSLPPLPATGWEESASMAAAMSPTPQALLQEMRTANLALAGRAAAQPDVRPRLDAEFSAQLRDELVTRVENKTADVRDRLACAIALGQLGDSRFTAHRGVDSAYLLPPLIPIRAGAYPLGSDEPIAGPNSVDRNHLPAHTATLEAFRIGRFPVTNAEWACFMRAGGYETSTWWVGAAARAWLSGEGTEEGRRRGLTWWLQRLRAGPELLDQQYEEGLMTRDVYDRWRRRLSMTDAQFEHDLRQHYPDGPIRSPRHWDDPAFNGPTQPVVGVSWYEACAYCRWLTHQSGIPLRLPSEAEWESACRGMNGSRFAWGNEPEPLRANLPALHVRTTTPVGMFPEGDTAFGVSDMTGQVWEWTSTAWGTDASVPHFGHPYDAHDGRESVDLDGTWCRVVKGGSFAALRGDGRADFRGGNWPSDTGFDRGFRIVTSAA